MNKQQKKVFSIASKYNEVYEILQKVPNQSEFICQAIIEKFNKKENTNNINDEMLDKKIRSILSEIITEDHIVIAHAGTLPETNIKYVEQPVIKETPKEETKTEEEDIDDIKSAIANW